MNDNDGLSTAAIAMLMLLVSFDNEPSGGRRSAGDRMWINDRMVSMLGGLEVLVELVSAELLEATPGRANAPDGRGMGVHSVRVLALARERVAHPDESARARHRSLVAELSSVLQVGRAVRA